VLRYIGKREFASRSPRLVAFHYSISGRIGEQIISEGVALQESSASYYDILDTYPDFLYKVGEYRDTHCLLTGLPFLKAHVLAS